MVLGIAAMPLELFEAAELSIAQIETIGTLVLISRARTVRRESSHKTAHLITGAEPAAEAASAAEAAAAAEAAPVMEVASAMEQFVFRVRDVG